MFRRHFCHLIEFGHVGYYLAGVGLCATLARRWPAATAHWQGGLILDLPESWEAVVRLAGNCRAPERLARTMHSRSPSGDGPKIVECNFLGLPNTGKFFVSGNAAAFRILLLATLEVYISEMATAREVAISRGRWPDVNRGDAFEFYV
jgi:hypothetical protein